MDNNIQKYLFGLEWCLKLYSTGKFIAYDYVYTGISLHPLSLLMCLNLGKLFNKISTIKKIPSEIYPVVVLPYHAKELIPKKYHHIMDTKLKYIYDEEFC